MDDVKYRYIQNTYGKPITCNIRDGSGKITATKKFMPFLTEKFSGKVLHTGYERLTEDEYESLCKTSRTFKVYSGETGKAKFLVVHDELPAEAKTPHEALLDARKDAKKAAAEVAGLKAEITELKAALLDAQNKYSQLSSASSDEEKLKPLNDKIDVLESEKAALQVELDELQRLVDELRPPEDKTVELTEKLSVRDLLVKEFVTAVANAKEQEIKGFVESFVKGFAELEESKDFE